MAGRDDAEGVSEGNAAAADQQPAASQAVDAQPDSQPTTSHRDAAAAADGAADMEVAQAPADASQLQHAQQRQHEPIPLDDLEVCRTAA
jgi:hypothetical protein